MYRDAYLYRFPWEFYRFSKPHHVPKSSKLFSKRQLLLFQYVKKVSATVHALHSLRYFQAMKC